MPTIEQNLERIADALEKIAESASNFNFASVGNVTIATTQASEPDTSAADKAAADKAASDKAAADKKAADKKAADKAAADKKAADDKAAADAKAAEDKAAADALGGDTGGGDKPKASKDDVRKALQAYREIEGTPAMLEVLKKAGATTLNDLAEAKYDEVVAAVS